MKSAVLRSSVISSRRTSGARSLASMSERDRRAPGLVGLGVMFGLRSPCPARA